MIVRLVLEEVEPILLFAAYVHLDANSACVDLLGLVQPRELPGGLQRLRADGAHVHEAHGLLVTAELMAKRKIGIERRLDLLISDLDIRELRAERGVAAMIRPVRVHHLHFCDGGVASLVLEVSLQEGDISQIHGKPTV